MSATTHGLVDTSQVPPEAGEIAAAPRRAGVGHKQRWSANLPRDSDIPFCERRNLAPSSIAGVDRAMVLDSTDATAPSKGRP